MTIVTPPCATIRNRKDAENDFDCEDVKYHKRRHLLQRLLDQRQKYTAMKVFGIVLLFVATVMIMVNYTQTTVQLRKREEIRARRLRAAEILKQRLDELGSDEPPLGNDNVADEPFSEPFPKETHKLARNMLVTQQHEFDSVIRSNVHGGIRWVKPSVLPPLPGQGQQEAQRMQKRTQETEQQFFHISRQHEGAMKWEQEWKAMKASGKPLAPVVDYTNPKKYKYPALLSEPPAEGGYPSLVTLEQMMADWDQDADFEGTITETLIHFNYSDPVQREAARRFRDAELPFKLVDVPEVAAATAKWTDEYVSEQFDQTSEGGVFGMKFRFGNEAEQSRPAPAPAHGTAQESPNNFFAFYVPKYWDVDQMGLPPVRNSDWTFAKFAEHARYADASHLSFDQPHFYWQSGVERTERYEEYSKWSFISRDLPSFSSTDENFFVFHPEAQKGIQCRFGERGVVAAQHYDSGRNMIAMVTGAKRYILAPPRECSKLGLWTQQRHPIFRHSLLNFAHFKHLHNDSGRGMSPEERAWLERAASSRAVETVLKAGEVLYLPSFWFHYIVSIQKSAQCNVRSGIDELGTQEFGNHQDVLECTD